MNKPPQRRMTPHWVALVVEQRTPGASGPARVAVRRRLQRQAEALALYGLAPFPSRAAPRPPSVPAQILVAKDPFAALDALNAAAPQPAPVLALAAATGPFRCMRDAERYASMWRGDKSEPADVLLAVGCLVAARAKRKYAVDLGLVYGDLPTQKA